MIRTSRSGAVSLISVFTLAALLSPFSPAYGDQGAAAPDAPAPQSTYDKVWQRFTRLYRDDGNPVVQQVLFTGRYQHDFTVLDADVGDHHESNVRRMRLGPRITLFRTFTVHAEVELNPQERDPFFVRFTDLYVQWTRSRGLSITVGKHGVPFTVDGATSSKDLLAVDRSNLSNNLWFPQEYMPGVSVGGRHGPWIYRTGLFSAGAADRGLGDFNGGFFTLFAGGYDFATSLGVTEAVLTGNYVHQRPDRDNTFTRPLDHVGSINFRFEDDHWGFRSDVSTASGYLGQSSVWGLMAMPFVNVTGALQVVGRFTFLESAAINGVRLATYENVLVPGRGDRYAEWYGGVNYYFYGHRLKLQSGLQFADMDDEADDGGAYSGVAWTTGLRVGW